MTTLTTNIGIPQGDSASAFFFITYLAEALKDSPTSQPQDTQTTDQKIGQRPKRKHKKPAHLSDYIIMETKQTNNKDYQHDQHYADDLGYMSNNLTHIDMIKRTIPRQVEQYNLTVNLQKTEQHTVQRHGKTTKALKLCLSRTQKYFDFTETQFGNSSTSL